MALMRIPDWAEHVGVTSVTAAEYVRRGKIPFVEIGGNRKVAFIDSETPVPVFKRVHLVADPVSAGVQVERADAVELKRRYGSVAKGVRAAVNLLLRGSEGER